MPIFGKSKNKSPAAPAATPAAAATPNAPPAVGSALAPQNFGQPYVQPYGQTARAQSPFLPPQQYADARRASMPGAGVAPPAYGEDADFQQITPNIWLGSYKALKADALQRHGIRYVVNTAKELKTRKVVDWGGLQRSGIIVMHVQWEDTITQQVFPSKPLNDAIIWIDQVIASGNNVLINCAMGRSRSTSLVIAYMMMRLGYNYDQALATIQSKRRVAQPNKNFEDQLRHMHRSIEAKKAGGQPAAPQPAAPVPAAPAAPQIPQAQAQAGYSTGRLNWGSPYGPAVSTVPQYSAPVSYPQAAPAPLSYPQASAPLSYPAASPLMGQPAYSPQFRMSMGAW